MELKGLKKRNEELEKLVDLYYAKNEKLESDLFNTKHKYMDLLHDIDLKEHADREAIKEDIEALKKDVETLKDIRLKHRMELDAHFNDITGIKCKIYNIPKKPVTYEYKLCYIDEYKSMLADLTMLAYSIDDLDLKEYTDHYTDILYSMVDDVE